MSKDRKEKRKGLKKFHIECVDCASDQPGSYKALDVSEEGTFSYGTQTITVHVDTLIEIRALGWGHFGNVMLAEVRNYSGFQMAVKRLNLLPSTNNPGDYTAQTDLQTIRKVGSGENPHVTIFYTAFVDQGSQQLLIGMEACDTSMENFYKTMHRINELQYLDLLLKRMTNQIVDALRFLKVKKILHRDVKPSNILINQNPVIFKLCDFGICGQLIDSLTRTMTIGTQIYLAPERMDSNLSPQGYGIQSDMWSLGLSILEIATNEHPFRGLPETSITSKLKTWTPERPACLSSELQDLIILLLRKDQADRPRVYDDILQLPALQSLPTKITDAEAQMVRNVIPQIPPVSEI